MFCKRLWFCNLMLPDVGSLFQEIKSCFCKCLGCLVVLFKLSAFSLQLTHAYRSKTANTVRLFSVIRIVVVCHSLSCPCKFFHFPCFCVTCSGVITIMFSVLLGHQFADECFLSLFSLIHAFCPRVKFVPVFLVVKDFIPAPPHLLHKVFPFSFIC